MPDLMRAAVESGGLSDDESDLDSEDNSDKDGGPHHR